MVKVTMHKMNLMILSWILFVMTGLHAQNQLSELSYNALIYDKPLSGFNGDAHFTGFQQDIVVTEKKSVGQAMLLSLIIPGAGEYYVGETFYTKLFLGMEVLGWGSIFFNDKLYTSLKKDYRNYASLHAGVQSSKKADKYWGDIGKYDDIYSYNIQRRRDRALNEIYSENETYYWDWDSRENRFVYDTKRLDAAKIKDREIFFVTGLLINHLVSAINAVRLARRFNKNISASNFNYHFVLDIQNPQNKYFGLILNKSF